jgi:hypothetical protein
MQIDELPLTGGLARYGGLLPEEALRTGKGQDGGQGGTEAPPVNDDKELEFDWPSEEIRRACEAMFPHGDPEVLPALKWIPDERDGGQGS